MARVKKWRSGRSLQCGRREVLVQVTSGVWQMQFGQWALNRVQRPIRVEGPILVQGPTLVAPSLRIGKDSQPGGHIGIDVEPASGAVIFSTRRS